jgi:phospholipid/cholesterol/gamma-HCH transport system substrate-binding protein
MARSFTASRGIAEILTGAAVLLVAAGFLVYAVAHSGRSVGSGYPLSARFDHVDGLVLGADVRLAGVKVGSVRSLRVDPKTFLAEVVLNVRDDIRLPKDTSVEVTSESLLGGKFLNLTPGGDADDLPAGGTIAITQSSISLEQLLGKFIFSATSLGDKSKGAANKDADPKGSDPGEAEKGALK